MRLFIYFFNLTFFIFIIIDSIFIGYFCIIIKKLSYFIIIVMLIFS